MHGGRDLADKPPVLLVVDYPGRRDEDRIADLGVEAGGFEFRSLLTEPFVRASTAAGYAAELVRRSGPFPAETTAVLAYCMAAPIAQEVAALISAGRSPVPLVLFDGEPATAAAVHEQYLVTATQMASRLGTGSPGTAIDLTRMTDLLSRAPEAAIELMRDSLVELGVTALADDADDEEAADIAADVAEFYLDWLVHLVAAHNASWPPWGGDVLHVMSRDHAHVVDWPGAADTRRVRLDVPRPRLLSTAAAREITETWLNKIIRGRGRIGSAS